MLKDKPDQYLPAKSTSKRQRTWILSIIATLALVYYFGFYHSSNQIDVHPIHGTKIDWSRYAYSQYATDQHYLCNSIMVFDSLQQLKSKADRVLFYPKSWDLEVASSKDRVSQLLVMARDTYKVKLRPTEMYTLQRPENDLGETTWDASINKLNAFRLGEYERIIHLDSDITLNKHLDDLFFLPSATVAMPRAYWKLSEAASQGSHGSTGYSTTTLTSLLIVLEPSESEYTALWSMAQSLEPTISSNGNNNTSSLSSLTTTTTQNLFDMDLLNTRYATHALILPHTHLTLLTGEFRLKDHTTYLGPASSSWNPHTALKQASIIHFSDWPVPKPWIATPNSLYREMRPACDVDNDTPDERGCEDREVWKGVYDEFRRRRKRVCGLLSVPAPEWPPRRRGPGQNLGMGVVMG